MSQSLSDIMLPEFDRETERTWKVLKSVTPESMTFKPTESLHTIGWNANHLLSIVGWVPYILVQDSLDIAPVEGPLFASPNFAEPSEIESEYKKVIPKSRTALQRATDETMAEAWSLKMKGQVLFTLSKGECLRTWILNHTVHHRAILSVYMRMYGIELPSVFEME